MVIAKVEENDDDESGDDLKIGASRKKSTKVSRNNKIVKDEDKSLKRSIKKAKIEVEDEDKIPKTKQSKKLERLEEARKAYKWWEAEELPEGIQWRKLEHTGLVFPPPYKRHNITFLYDGEPFQLTDEQEEIATFYATIPEDGPQLGNPKIRSVFQTNFFKDFKDSFPSNSKIKSFAKCDFSRIKEYLDLQKSLKKVATSEEKTLKKSDKESIMQRQGFALIDGRLEKV